MVMKDILPTNLLTNVNYFECRQCGSWYVGRTLQCLSTHIKQHVLLYLLSSGGEKFNIEEKKSTKGFCANDLYATNTETGH